jgi:NAD(P)-dependent dehydrogenase (short-subunit alcohol dehydrogenase family)
MLRMDVTDDASVQQGIDTVLSREGRLDIVVNNAGIAIAGAVENTSIAEARQQLDVNFFGAFRVCRAALPAMRRQKAGYIVNIGSIGGLISIPYQALYSASKFALEGLTEALRMEARPFGVKVVIIEPGDHKTALTENRRLTGASADDEEYRHFCERALERMASDEQNGPEPEGIARLLYRIVNSPNPRLRYTIGPPGQRAAAWIKRLLPYSIFEFGMRRYYGLG